MANKPTLVDIARTYFRFDRKSSYWV